LKLDPIPRFQKKLIEMSVLTPPEADRILQEAATEVAEAVKFAEDSPYPSLEEVLTDVYA
jgi:pyruvate dehydrogenase E1 component alpha subunit